MSRSIALALAAITAISPIAPQTAYAQTTASPIKHVVVIFQENISFDHYFATYPKATNPSGEPKFVAANGTPTVNGLTAALASRNPNSRQTANGTGASNPFRLDRSQAATADQDHDYTPEQSAFDMGLMDMFPAQTGTAGPPPSGITTTKLVMGYYDGNTVTALWNYAQYYAMNDNSYGTNFGPSTVGAINLISGQTNGVSDVVNPSGSTIEDGQGGTTLIGDSDPIGDTCSTTSGTTIQMSGTNIGDLLNEAGVTWGWFEGGFNLSLTNSNGTTGCSRSTTSSVTGVTKADYIPHHEPFQYYTSTANPTHARPTSTASIGSTDAANHQYDIQDFFTAVSAGNFPAVSFLKAPGYQDGHAGYSDPLDEQNFIVTTINFLEQQPEWPSTAIVIAYDDSDGWYDHQMPPIVNGSSTSADTLTGAGSCGSGGNALRGVNSAKAVQGRCGYGPRLPFLVISPYSQVNYVDHTLTDQTSIIRFIEDNWLSNKRIGEGSMDGIANSFLTLLNLVNKPNTTPLLLDPNTGLITSGGDRPAVAHHGVTP